MTTTASLTVECEKLQKVIFARNREIAGRDAVIKRLKARIAELEAVREAAKAYLRATPEWVTDNHGQHWCCPVCDCDRSPGHDKNCEWAALQKALVAVENDVTGPPQESTETGVGAI